MSLKDLIRRALYYSGVLPLFHRLRNRHTLTVFMFHRVLPRESEAYARAEKEFTFTCDGFARCVDFINQHYRLISLEDLRDFEQIGRFSGPLGLITFDDGWRDTLDFAWPELKKRGLPAVLFETTEPLDDGPLRWWQDILVELMEDRDRRAALATRLACDEELLNGANQAHVLSAKLSELPSQKRHEILAEFMSDHCGERQMLDRSEIATRDRRLAVAGHGHCHGPLTELNDPDTDLRLSREVLKTIDGSSSDVMSFPHGSFNQDVIQLARNAGFSVLFSSEPELMNMAKLDFSQKCIGRIHIPENEWTCGAKGIDFPKLATFLFFRTVDSQ